MYTSIDLFAAGGGLTYGFDKAGLCTLATVDNDPTSIKVLRYNLPDIPYVLCRDLTQFGPDDLSRETGITSVDVISGCPTLSRL